MHCTGVQSLGTKCLQSDRQDAPLIDIPDYPPIRRRDDGYAMTRPSRAPKANDASPGQCIQWVPLTVCPRATNAPSDVRQVWTDDERASGISVAAL